MPRTTTIDLVDLEIRWERLISLMDEVDNATVTTSFSTIVDESRVLACIQLDAWGVSLSQSSFSPPDFCVSITRTSRAMLAHFPHDTLEEGDVLVTNDPWIGDGRVPDYFDLTSHRCGTADAPSPSSAPWRTSTDVGGHPGDTGLRLGGESFLGRSRT